MSSPGPTLCLKGRLSTLPPLREGQRTSWLSLTEALVEGSGQGAPRQEGSLSGCSGPGRPVEEARLVQLCPAAAPRGFHAQAGTQCSSGQGHLVSKILKSFVFDCPLDLASSGSFLAYHLH